MERLNGDAEVDAEHYEQLWKSLVKITKYSSRKYSTEVTQALKNIFYKLSLNSKQTWFLSRFKTNIQSGEDEHIFQFASSFHLKVNVFYRKRFLFCRFIRKMIWKRR